MNLNKRLAFSIFWVACGVTLIVLSCLDVIDGTLWSGMGGALCAVGITQIVRQVKLRTDPEFREKMRIAETDERNRYIRLKAWAWAGYCTVILGSLAVIGLLIANLRHEATLISFCVCFLMCANWISYFVLQKKE